MNFLDDCFPPSRDPRQQSAISYRTANDAGGVLRLSALITGNAPNIANLRNDEWYVIAPIGEFPSPDGTYTQILSADQAVKIVKTWNSISGKAARMFKNVMHGLGAKFSTPVFDGHPETNKDRWPIARLLAETTDLRASGNALEGKLTWNEKGMERRTRGPLYPSPLWWHEPPNDERKVFPELLESIGLVPTPNISSVPAWTQNASPDATDSQTNDTNMLKKLIELLGLTANATEDEAIAKVGALQSTANSTADNLKTANSAKEKAETDLKTANTAKEKAEIDLKTANTAKEKAEAELKTANTAIETLTDGILDLFETAGKFTPAERPTVKAKFTANVANSATEIAELKKKKPAINTEHLEINGNRIDISTANARQNAVQSLVHKKMKEDSITYNEAYPLVANDPNNKQLFDAMADPTNQKAA